jgi:hypothetical protein
VNAFDIDSSTGQLLVGDPSLLDHEREFVVNGEYFVTLLVTDSGTIGGQYQGNLSTEIEVRVVLFVQALSTFPSLTFYGVGFTHFSQVMVVVNDVNEPPVVSSVAFEIAESCGNARSECSVVGGEVLRFSPYFAGVADIPGSWGVWWQWIPMMVTAKEPSPSRLWRAMRITCSPL